MFISGKLFHILMLRYCQLPNYAHFVNHSESISHIRKGETKGETKIRIDNIKIIHEPPVILEVLVILY